MPDLSDRLADLGFRLRGAITWSAPAWKIPARSMDRVLGKLSAQARARAQELAARRDLSCWPRLLNAIELQENLYLLDLLDRFVPPLPADLPGLDVGSRNGSILPALHAASARPWDLVELDAHRRYLDLSTRRAHGERMARAFPGCRYVAGSVTTLTGSYAVVTWFLPFVREAPLQAWGLPLRFFQPAELLGHVLARVAPGGALIVANQGGRERDTQRDLFAAAGVRAEELGLLESPLSPFQRPRYGFRWVRPR